MFDVYVGELKYIKCKKKEAEKGMLLSLCTLWLCLPKLSCLYLKLNKFAWYVEQQQPKININIVLPPESETTKQSFSHFFLVFVVKLFINKPMLVVDAIFSVVHCFSWNYANYDTKP